MSQVKLSQNMLPTYIESGFEQLPSKGESSVEDVFHQQIDNYFCQRLTLEDKHESAVGLPAAVDTQESCDAVVGAVKRRVVDKTFNTEYTIVIRELEYPVIGTYVDETITIGFYYRVRRISTDSYLWGGRPRCLVSIGMGYGKRITFRSDNEQDATDFYMYSDTEAEGFAFIPAIPEEAGCSRRFLICDSNKREIASVTLTSICPDNEVMLTPPTLLSSSNSMEARFSCRFSCDISVSSYPGGVVPLEASVVRCELEGVASVVRRGGAKNSAYLEKISEVNLPSYFGTFTMVSA